MSLARLSLGVTPAHSVAGGSRGSRQLSHGVREPASEAAAADSVQCLSELSLLGDTVTAALLRAAGAPCELETGGPGPPGQRITPGHDAATVPGPRPGPGGRRGRIIMI